MLSCFNKIFRERSAVIPPPNVTALANWGQVEIDDMISIADAFIL